MCVCLSRRSSPFLKSQSTVTTFQTVSLEMMHKPFPSRGGAPLALKLSTGAFVSVSKAMLICISALNLVYLLLNSWYHFGAWRVKQSKTTSIINTKSTTAGNILEGSKYISCSFWVLSLLLKYFSHFLPKNVILLRNLTELPLGKNKFRLPIFHFPNPSFFHFFWYTFAAGPHFSFVPHVSNEGKGKLALTKTLTKHKSGETWCRVLGNEPHSWLKYKGFLTESSILNYLTTLPQ